MNKITKLATKLLATLSIVGMLSTPVAAQGLKAADMALAFGQAPQTARNMSAVEMDETEGAVLGPVVRIAIAAGKAVVKEIPEGHKTNKTPSNLPKHQKGDAHRKTDARGEKGDARRPY